MFCLCGSLKDNSGYDYEYDNYEYEGRGWHSGHQCVPGSIPGVEVTCKLNWHVVG